MVPRVRQFLVPVAAFGLGVGIAELAGAANLGTAFGVGQIAFALAVLGVLLR
jgi:Na+/H+-dicarboxylate symporter